MTERPTLDHEELAQITGYRQAAAQLRELQRQGFWRARRSPTTGDVILERAHYLAISGGQRADAPQERQPRLRNLRAA